MEKETEEAKQPDQLLAHALITIEMELKNLRSEAMTGQMEDGRSRILAAYAKVLLDMNREMRQTVKELDLKKTSTDDLREQLEKIDEELSKTKKK